MLKIMITLLMILCLNSCNTFDRKLICGQIKKHQIGLHKSCDISFDFNRCRCRCFNMNSWTEEPLKTCKEFSGVKENEIRKVKKKSGEIYEAVNYPLDHCNGISGFFLDDIASDIRPQVKALSNIKQNLCGE